MNVTEKKFATKKKLKNLINKFEKSCRDYENLGSQPVELHDEIETNYKQAKTKLDEFIDVLYMK